MLTADLAAAEEAAVAGIRVLVVLQPQDKGMMVGMLYISQREVGAQGTREWSKSTPVLSASLKVEVGLITPMSSVLVMGRVDSLGVEAAAVPPPMLLAREGKAAAVRVQKEMLVALLQPAEWLILVVVVVDHMVAM